MVGSSASKIVCTVSEDRLSDLPKNVINMILDALPLCDAVRTSLLSRKWQYLWVTISNLVFDDQFFTSMDIKHLSMFQVKDIINDIMLLHTGPILKFILDHDPEYTTLMNNISPWLHFLSRDGIKELTLHFPCKLGLHLFCCRELTHISIANCQLNPPAEFEGFPNLTTLELDNIYVNGQLGDIISACHLLERVSIEDCNGICNLVVSSHYLKYLHVKRVSGIKTIRLNSSKDVVTLSIGFWNGLGGGKMEKLYIGDTILELSDASNVPKRLPTSLENLKKVVLRYVDFSNAAQILCALCMIQSSPKLSELEILGSSPESTYGEDLDFVKFFSDSNGSFGHLKTVKLMRLSNLKAELGLIKLLLARSPLLESLSIYVAEGNSYRKDKAFSMCKKLMEFGRASPKAAVVVLDSCYPS